MLGGLLAWYYLIVPDNSFALIWPAGYIALLFLAFTTGGHRALDRRHASELQARPRIDLLFTDIVMPGMNGRQLAEAALKIKHQLKVLYTTGYTRNHRS